MDFIQNLKGLTISLAIIILIPLAVYWGSQYIAPGPTGSNPHYYSKEEIQKLKKSGTDIEDLKKQYDSKRNRNEQAYLIFSLVVGCLAILVGLIIRVSFLDFGLICAGVLTLLFGSWSYLSLMTDLMKFVVISAVLFGLIILSYRSFKR
ncbi:MAG TPA: hypothetical protein VJ201_04290 [Candidatus Babeliales bacterium]|nr:hypothetical protein [Candidatus Babeliales bacterium]